MPLKPSIVLVGFKPENKIVPDNLKDFLIKALEGATRDVEGAGYDLAIIDPVPYLEKGLQHLTDYFSQQRPVGVVVGFGVRAQPEHTFIFEQLVEAVRHGSPEAKLMFNTNPGSTLEAIQRWLPVHGETIWRSCLILVLIQRSSGRRRGQQCMILYDVKLIAGCK